MSGVHRRLNLLTGDWVLVSPHRLDRPWQGETQAPASPAIRAYDPECYLCPGNARANGARNPPYETVYVFDNDFPSLQASSDYAATSDLLVSVPETGHCRVICYAPEHHLTFATLGADRIRTVIDCWAGQFAELAAKPDIGAVTIFENRGAMMGASNPHPHGQIWATACVPSELDRENRRQEAYMAKAGRPLLAAYLEREIADGERVVAADAEWVALVPFWAVWPFELLLLPRRAVPDLAALDPAERDSLARVLAQICGAYDRLFGAPFPYSMGFHQRPLGAPAPHFTLHAHFYPPLLRSAGVRKHLVGFEMLAMPQRDLTPEAAAERLRAANLPRP